MVFGCERIGDIALFGILLLVASTIAMSTTVLGGMDPVVEAEQAGEGAAEQSSGEAGDGALLASELLSDAEEEALLAAVVGGPTEADLEELVRKCFKISQHFLILQL